MKLKKVSSNFEINLLNQPPSHIGLGSGSQLSLCLGKSILTYLDIKASISDIARIYDRGERLIVLWAIKDGRDAAIQIQKYLKNNTKRLSKEKAA